MNDFDLDRLGDVWRQQPDPGELEALRRSADYVRRRARWAQAVDIASALVVAGVILFLVLSNPQKDTLVVGSAAILVLLFGQQRQRRLRREELKGLTGSAEEMLVQSVVRAEATLRRTKFSLFTLPPALGLGIVLSYVVDTGAEGELLTRFSSDPTISTLLKVLIGVLVIIAGVYLVSSMRRHREELERLKGLSDAYRQEREVSAGDEGVL